MNCAEVRTLLSALADGEIADDRLREKVQSHMDNCEACRQEYALQLDIKSKLSELEPEEASVFLATRVTAEIKQLRRRRSVWRWSYAYAGAAAVIALVVMLGGGLLVHPSAQGVYKSLPDVAPATVALPRSSNGDGYGSFTELVVGRHEEARELLKVREEWAPEFEQIVQRLGGEEDDESLYKELPKENTEDEEELAAEEE